MGTSKSSSGPGKGVNLVPEWLDTPAMVPPPPQVPDQVVPPIPGIPPAPLPPTPLPAPPPVAPVPGVSVPRRFNDARRSVGEFIRKGDRGSLRGGFGHYVRTGYRGSRNAAARMGQAATSAANAYGVLTGVAAGTATPESLGFDPAALAGAPIDDVVDALVDAICRTDTTLDDNAGRDAVGRALSEVLQENPEVDALAMPVAHAEEVWLRTLAYHVFDNMMTDFGSGLQNAAAGDHVLFNDRCVEIRGFVLENYREQLGLLGDGGQRPTSTVIGRLGRQLNTMVFETYGGWLA